MSAGSRKSRSPRETTGRATTPLRAPEGIGGDDELLSGGGQLDEGGFMTPGTDDDLDEQ
jgi:hypothetical protein